MAINNAIRLLTSVLLVALAAPALSAQGISDPTNGGGQEAIGGVDAKPPATLAESLPRAPKVTCDGDQLTISANNSTLGSVLAAVHACIGIQIDIPAGAGGGRTFEQLGPGPERQVLESLLSGTDFNYVIGSSDADPGKVETVLLMERTTEVAANAPPSDRSLSPARRLWLGAVKNARRADTSGDDGAQPTDETSEAPAVDEPAPPPAPAENVNAAPTPAPASDTPAPTADASPAPPTVPEGAALTSTGSPAPELSPSVGPVSDTSKSTEQRIADMQQMFEQRKQIGQSQNSSSGQPQQP
jgi:hypothetical protein